MPLCDVVRLSAASRNIAYFIPRSVRPRECFSRYASPFFILRHVLALCIFYHYLPREGRVRETSFPDGVAASNEACTYEFSKASFRRRVHEPPDSRSPLYVKFALRDSRSRTRASLNAREYQRAAFRTREAPGDPTGFQVDPFALEHRPFLSSPPSSPHSRLIFLNAGFNDLNTVGRNRLLIQRAPSEPAQRSRSDAASTFAKLAEELIPPPLSLFFWKRRNLYGSSRGDASRFNDALSIL